MTPSDGATMASGGTKERPILFSGPMVRALLADAKTQTRRILKLRTKPNRLIYSPLYQPRLRADGLWSDSHCLPFSCPYGQPGDRLWVRETHAQFAVGNRSGKAPQCVAYRATCEGDSFDYVNNGDEIMRISVSKWTPSIHMPRWASRINLEITEVRVERLQEISEEDAEAEGIEGQSEPTGGDDYNAVYRNYLATKGDAATYPWLREDPIGSYRSLWNSINGPGSWDLNPWVWAISFKKAAQ
jgi:hypothetical protein